MKSIKPFNLIYSFILFFFLHISYAHIENTHDHEREKWFFQDSSGPFIAEFISFNGSDVFLKQKNKILKYELSKFSMEDQLTILKKDELVKKINTTSPIKKYSDSKFTLKSLQSKRLIISFLVLILSLLTFISLFPSFIAYSRAISIITYILLLIFLACDSKEIIAESGNDDEILVTSSVDNNTSNSSNTTSNEANSSNNLELIKSYFNNFSDVSITSNNDYFFVSSYSWPNHPMGIGISSWQEQVPIPQNYTGDNSWQIPLNPKMAETPTDTSVNLFRGAIAIAINGIPIFNVLNNRGENAYEKGELDNWGGHFGRGDDYHYHMIPLHLQEIVGDDQPLAFGLDGYPVYGLTTENLDEAFGRYDSNGNYRYHASSKSPYYMPFVKGEIDIVNDGIDPQPSQNPIRPSDSFKPVSGATVTGFTQTGKNSFSFEYTVDGVKYYVNYNWDENCKFTFTYIDENGGTTNLPHNGSLADNSSENSESHINQDACKDVVYNSG